MTEIKISQKEHEELKRLYDKGFNYLARDMDGELYAFDIENIDSIHKDDIMWNVDMFDCNVLYVIPDYFKFIEWEDVMPHSIDKLLKIKVVN